MSFSSCLLPFSQSATAPSSSACSCHLAASFCNFPVSTCIRFTFVSFLCMLSFYQKIIFLWNKDNYFPCFMLNLLQSHQRSQIMFFATDSKLSIINFRTLFERNLIFALVDVIRNPFLYV